jgi:hypothetical protein
MSHLVIGHADDRDGPGIQHVAAESWRATYRDICHVHAKNEIGKAFYLKHGFVHVPDRDHEDEWCIVKRIGPAV